MDELCQKPECNNSFTKKVHNQKYCSPQCKRDVENVSKRRQLTEDVANAVASVYMAADGEDQLEFLRRENGRLARAAEKYRANTSELVNAVYRAAYDAVSSLEMPVIDPPNAYDSRFGGDEEVAVAIFGDWQLGKRTSSYNSDVCEDRINLYGDKLLKIVNVQRADHPVNHLRVWMVGDMVEGEDIFSGQAHLIDSSLYTQVSVNGPRILRDFILKMLSEFETVTLTGVVGNHGAIGGVNRRTYNSETNMDRLLYKIIEWMFAYEKRVNFNIPEGHGESSFYAVDTIGDYSTLLVHGDQFPSPSTQHVYYKKVMGWKDGAIPERFHDVYMGHYHTNTKMTLGSSILRIVGSPESNNTFAQEVLASMGRPSQDLQFVHPENGITSEWCVWLT